MIAVSVDTQFLDDFQRLIAPANLRNSSFYSSSLDLEFHVVDKPPLCIVTAATLSFIIRNPSQTLIHLLAIDQGFDACLTGYSGKRPEGILLNQNDFCFVELKLNVTSKSATTQTDRIEEAIQKFNNFIPDLKSRFSTLLAKDFMLLGFSKYEAYIVLPASKYPRFSASQANRKEAFRLMHNIELFEINIKVFS